MASSATFLAVNSMPWDERNSFAAWHDCQVVDQYTVMLRFAISYSPVSRPPKMRSPSLKPSATVAPAPSAVGFAFRHALRCSSDRKKLIVVQSESATLHRSSVRFPSHSMTPSASGPGPSGETENSTGIVQWWQRDRISTG